MLGGRSASTSPRASPRTSIKSPRVLISKTISGSAKVHATVANDDFSPQPDTSLVSSGKNNVRANGTEPEIVLYRKSSNNKEFDDLERSNSFLRSNDSDYQPNERGLVVRDFDNDLNASTDVDDGYIGRVSSTSSKRSMRGKSRGIQWAASSSQRHSSSSFMSNASSNSNPTISSVETLINFLTAHLPLITSDREYLRQLEEMSADVLAESPDVEVQRIFKAHGWTGSRYRNSEEKPVEAASLLQALSNLYLKNKMQQYTSHISSLLGNGDEKGADQILSFCPDLLLTCLKKHGAPKAHEKELVTHTFMGACMLADISGFSKFSGAMCLKGASGLDDLRDATSVFLGHLVKTVYEFQGDGKSLLIYFSFLLFILFLLFM